MAEFTKSQFSVLEAAQTLAGHATGTAEGLQADHLLQLRDWLFWRITLGWQDVSPSPGYTALMATYDAMVRGLALAAIKLSESTLPGRPR